MQARNACAQCGNTYSAEARLLNQFGQLVGVGETVDALDQIAISVRISSNQTANPWYYVPSIYFIEFTQRRYNIRCELEA